MRPRPAGLVVVTGTGTGVGKTWFAAVTLGLLRSRGTAVAARKPVQSFDPDERPRDADVLAAATGEDSDASFASPLVVKVRWPVEPAAMAATRWVTSTLG